MSPLHRRSAVPASGRRVAALVVMLVAASGIVPVAQSANAASRSADRGIEDRCPEALVYLARGDHEDPRRAWPAGHPPRGERGFGELGKAVLKAMRKKGGIPVSTSLVAVNFTTPRSAWLVSNPRRYAAAVREGVAALEAQLATVGQTPCLQNAQLGFVGYGAGAWVIRAVVGRLSPELRRNVSAVAVFGDPSADSQEKVKQSTKHKPRTRRTGAGRGGGAAKFLPRSLLRAYPKDVRGSVLNTCFVSDPVCSFVPRGGQQATADYLRRGLSVHRSYDVGAYWRAGEWLHQRFRDKQLFPQIDGRGGRFVVGRAGSFQVSVTGVAPPFDVDLSLSGLDGVGLVARGLTVDGTPVKSAEGRVDVTVVDAVGRRAKARFDLDVAYPPPTTSVVSENDGQDGHGNNIAAPSVSTGGAQVAFVSSNPALATGDTNASTDVFVRHRPSSELVLASRTPGGTPGNGGSGSPDIAADGSVVVFESTSTDLVSGGSPGVHAFDTASGVVSRVASGRSPTVSDDGGTLAYLGPGGDLRVARGTSAWTTEQLLPAPPEGLTGTQLSGDGQWVVFQTTAALLPADQNGLSDVYVLEVSSHQLRLASTDSSGAAHGYASYHPSISGTGRYVAFSATPHPGYFGDLRFRDMQETGSILLAEYINSAETTISGDGRHVAYEILSCRGNNAAVGYFDVTTMTTRGVWDTRPEGDFDAAYSATPDLSSDGRFVAFSSVPLNGPIDTVLADMLVP